MSEQQVSPTQTGPSQPPLNQYIEYAVDVAGAKKKAELYEADAATVDPLHDKLGEAQGAYETAKAAQQAAYDGLNATMTAIADTFACHPKKAIQDALKKCWNDVSKEDEQATAPVSCGKVDDYECWKNDPKSIEDFADLTSLAGQAAECATQADADFARLADLPAKLAERNAALDARAKALKQAICDTAAADLSRNFVLYLELKGDVAKLKADWIDPADYVSALKAAFELLVKRHVKMICIQVAITRGQKRKELEDKAKLDKAAQLINRVLACATAETTSTEPTPTEPTPTEPTPTKPGC